MNASSSNPISAQPPMSGQYPHGYTAPNDKTPHAMATTVAGTSALASRLRLTDRRVVAATPAASPCDVVRGRYSRFRIGVSLLYQRINVVRDRIGDGNQFRERRVGFQQLAIVVDGDVVVTESFEEGGHVVGIHRRHSHELSRKLQKACRAPAREYSGGAAKHLQLVSVDIEFDELDVRGPEQRVGGQGANLECSHVRVIPILGNCSRRSHLSVDCDRLIVLTGKRVRIEPDVLRSVRLEVGFEKCIELRHRFDAVEGVAGILRGNRDQTCPDVGTDFQNVSAPAATHQIVEDGLELPIPATAGQNRLAQIIIQETFGTMSLVRYEELRVRK